MEKRGKGERMGDTGEGRVTRARRDEKVYANEKKERDRERERTLGRTYPLIQDLFNYGPSPGLSRGRF